MIRTTCSNSQVHAFLAGAIIAARMLDADLDPAEVLLEAPAELAALAEESAGAWAGELRALAAAILREMKRGAR